VTVHPGRVVTPEIDDDPWTAIAEEWSQRWGGFAAPAQRAVLAAASVGRGTRVLDVGCGGGEFLELAAEAGAEVHGIDPARGMVDRARRRVPGADVRVGAAERLPLPDGSLDVVTVFNALQFTEDPAAAVAGAARVLVPGGRAGLATWAEGSRNDLDRVESAVSEFHGEEPREDRALSLEGELAGLLAGEGFTVVAAGIVEVPWVAEDDDALVRGVLLGEDAEGLASVGPVVVSAARPFRRADGGYVLLNAFRWVVGERA